MNGVVQQKQHAAFSWAAQLKFLKKYCALARRASTANFAQEARLSIEGYMSFKCTAMSRLHVSLGMTMS